MPPTRVEAICSSETSVDIQWSTRCYIPDQRCTRFLHPCSALCKCANWLCRTCTPHHTAAGRSSVSLTQSPFAFPSNCRCGPPLTSYMPGRSIPCTRAQHSSTHHRTLRAVHGLCISVLDDSTLLLLCCYFSSLRPRNTENHEARASGTASTRIPPYPSHLLPITRQFVV
jgi:hypothetical protein